MDPHLQRVFIHEISPLKRHSSSSLTSTRKALGHYRGAFLTAINDVAIFTKDQVEAMFFELTERSSTTFSVTLALEPKDPAALHRRKSDELGFAIERDADEIDSPPAIAPSHSVPSVSFHDSYADAAPADDAPADDPSLAPQDTPVDVSSTGRPRRLLVAILAMNVYVLSLDWLLYSHQCLRVCGCHH